MLPTAGFRFIDTAMLVDQRSCDFKFSKKNEPFGQRQFTKDLGFRGIVQAEALPRLQLGSGLVGDRGRDAERLVQRG